MEEKLALTQQLVKGLKAWECVVFGILLTINMKERPTSWHLMTFPVNR